MGDKSIKGKSRILLNKSIKKIYDMPLSELKTLANSRKNEKRKSKDFKEYGQFKRAEELSSNNYSLMKDILSTPLRKTEIAKDKNGKFLYTKKGTLKRKIKKN